MDEPIFFDSASAWRNWLSENHAEFKELWVGYFKKHTGKPSQTWSESVDEAICYGWIDGLRRSIDEERYMIRFTPRKPTSHWSAVNMKKVDVLKKLGKMKESGILAFQKRKPEKSGKASYEQGDVELPQEYLDLLSSNSSALDFFHKLAPGLKKQYKWWVISAKRKETRMRRMEMIINCSTRKELIPPLKILKKNNGKNEK